MSIGGIVESMAAFQAVGPHSNPGQCRQGFLQPGSRVRCFSCSRGTHLPLGRSGPMVHWSHSALLPCLVASSLGISKPSRPLSIAQLGKSRVQGLLWTTERFAGCLEALEQVPREHVGSLSCWVSHSSSTRPQALSCLLQLWGWPCFSFTFYQSCWLEGISGGHSAFSFLKQGASPHCVQNAQQKAPESGTISGEQTVFSLRERPAGGTRGQRVPERKDRV